MKKRIISFMTAFSMTLMMFTTMDVTSFTASADTANGTHTFTNPDTFFYIDEENKFDYKEYSLTQAEIGKAINHPGAFVNSVASITVNYKASADISGIIIAHSSDEANGWWAEESVSISKGSNSVTTAKPIKVDNGAVSFQIKTFNSDTNLIDKTLKINSVTLTGVEYVSEKIDADNFRFSIFNNTSMKIGDSFTVSYNAANTPPAAKYSFKYKVPKSDGSGYDYYTPVLNNKVNGTDGQEATGLEVTSSTAGDITTYTFTAIAASAAEFELYIEVSASGTWSDTAFAGSSAYKVVDSTPAPTLTFDPETANVNVGRTTTVTIIGKNTDGYEYTAKSYNDTIATATANGTVVTVTGVTIGLVKIKVTGKKSGADDITAEFTVNVPHDLEKHDAVSATCTTDGNEAYWTCSVKGCKKIFSNEDGTAEFDEIPVIPALGHDYVDGVCTRCYETEGITPTMTISPKTLTVPIGETAVITETVTNGGDCMYNETTSDADIVAITASSALENGVRTVTVEGRSAGTAVITLKIIKSDVEVIVETCNVTVTDGTTPTYTLTPEAATITVGDSQVFTLEGYEGTDPLSWSIDTNFARMQLDSELTEHQVKIIGIAKSTGPLTLTVKKTTGEIIATATVTIVDTCGAAGHEWDKTKWLYDDMNHWYACTKCGAKGEIQNHSLVSLENGTEATCTTPGRESDWKCNVCEYTETGKEIKALGHDYQEVPDSEKEPTCVEDGKEPDQKCSRCDKLIKGETITATGHTPATAWTSDITGHWHACAGCNEKLDFSAHTFDAGTVTTPPTETADGVKTYKCTVCEYAKTETIPATGADPEPPTPPEHTHTPTEAWTSDAAGHWHACAGCDEKLDFSEHTFDDGEVTTPPTETIDGVKTFKCTVCEYVKTETIPATGADPEPPSPPEHTHTPTEAWTSDAAGHWHACAGCDEKLDFSEHTFDDGEVTTPPTETIDGVKTYKCTVCEYVKTENVPATGADPEPPTPPEHTHVFGTDWKHSETRHWHECECGEKADEALHTPDGGTVTKQPTAYETGVRTYYCTVCGSFIFSETIPATGTDSSPSIPYFPPSGTVTHPVTASKEPYIQNDSDKKGWEVISDDILSTPDGETIKVKMNGATELPKNIVSDIAGRDIDLVLDMGGYSWTINGMSVTKAKDIDMRVRKVNKIPESAVQEFFGESKTVQLDLRHNGDFGFTAELTVDVGKRYSGKYANSYCFKSGNFEFGDSSEIVNGKAKLRFTHASSWLITIESSPVLEDISSGAAAHSACTPLDMSNSASGMTVPEFDENKKLRLSNSKRRYRILKKRKLDDLVFVL